MKPTVSLNLLTEALHSYMDRNEPFAEEYESEDEDDYFNDDDDDDSSIESVTDEKAFVCDYDKIYVCLYEELEEYRSSKQAKKKNTTSTWNNLLVVLPSGGITSMKTAPALVLKEARKLMSDNNKVTKIVENFQTASKIEEEFKQKPISLTTNNSNNVTRPSHEPEVKSSKIEPPKPNKPEKISKKKLKKQRQKEKKKGEKGKKKDPEEREEEEEKIAEEEEPEESLDSKSRSESKAESLDFAQDEVNGQESEEDSEATADIDLLDEIPAFVSNAVKKNEKKILSKKEKLVKASNPPKPNKKTIVDKKPVEKKPAVKPTSVTEINDEKQSVKAKPIPVVPSSSAQQPSVDPDFDFAVKRLKRPKATGNEYQEAVSLGREAFKLIMSDQMSQAIQFLSEAILVNTYDLRHFLNRSFCYLRLGAYNLALKDAQVVIKYTNESDELVKAKFRAGQALVGLQNFEEAEKYLDEAYNFSQADPYVHRELMRVRILQLLHMGFKERDILEAFKKHPSVSEVLAILTERTLTEEEDDCDYVSECDEDDIYNSDNEENPSFTRMFSNLLKYQQWVPKKIKLIPSSPLKTMTPIQQQPTASFRKMPVPTEPKKIITTIPPKIPVVSKEVNDKAIWVGNTSSEITENMLRKRFSKFGKIISIYRKPSENYTFINFETAKAVTELLASNTAVEVEGHKLPVKAATRAK